MSTASAERASRYAFFGVSAFLFAASSAVTIFWCASMSSTGGMPMPGGWTMSMAWMRMPGQTWTAAAATFLGMWIVMMLAMMLPTLVPALWRHSLKGRGAALAAGGYFFVWTLFGLAAFPLGVTLAAIQMQHPAISRATPVAAGLVVLIAGAIQFTRWKAHRLACCRNAHGPAPSPPSDASTAYRDGLRLGLECVRCCFNLMAILLVLGVMDLGAMVVVAAAITLERLAPGGDRVASVQGVVVVSAGLFLIARAAGLG